MRCATGGFFGQATIPARLHDAAVPSNRLIIKFKPICSNRDQPQSLASYRNRSSP